MATQNTQPIEVFIDEFHLDEGIEAARQLSQNDDGWFAARKNRLTASDAAQALGLSPYGTAEQLVARKCSSTRQPATAAQQRGLDAESRLVNQYIQAQQQATGAPWTALETGLWVHPEKPHLAASPDRILFYNDRPVGLLEVKSFSIVPDTLPPHVFHQVCMMLV